MSRIEQIEIAKIKPYDNNPRRNQPVDLVAKSIKEFGFNSPIIVDKDNVVIAGHTRLKAAVKLKLKKVPCIVADLSPEKAKAYRILDNKTSELAEWDSFLLDVEIKEIEELGFDTSDWGLEFTEEEEPELEIIDTDTQQNIEKYKQLVFLYEDSNKYASHWKVIQAIKYDFGFDTDDQIIEYLLSLYKKVKK
jgi:ParB-like chromosome segregation protein Spo0J